MSPIPATMYLTCALTPLAAAMVEPLSGWRASEEMLWRVGWVYMALLIVGVIVNVALFIYFQAFPLRWEERAACLDRNPWRSVEAARVLILLLALYFFASLVKRAFRSPVEEAPLWVILQSAFFHLAGIAFIAQALKRQHLGWRQAFGIVHGRVMSDVRTGVTLYLAMMPLLFFYSLLYQWVLRATGYTPAPQDIVQLFVSERSLWGRVYTFILAAIVAPVFEEMVFRGMALPVLARQRGAMWAVVVLAAAFALIHFHIPSLVPLFIVAVALNVGYIYSSSLVVPIVAHGLFNLVNLMVLSALQVLQ